MPDDGNYLIKLVKEGTRHVVMSAYLGGGNTKKFMVPLGKYSIYYAEGKIWCGEKDAFGRGNTRLARLVGSFAFTRYADGYRGVEIELTPQINGNLQSESVSDYDFSKLTPDDP